MKTWVGFCSREILRHLKNNEGECTISTLVTEVKAPRDTLYMALGWLVREDYVLLDGHEPDSVVKLKD